MRSVCCVPGCFSTSISGEIHFFPCYVRWENIIRENCGVPDWNHTRGSVICVRHFDDQYLRKFRFQGEDNEVFIDYSLCNGASPTIFYNDWQPQVVETQKFDSEEESGEDDDSVICITSISEEFKANVSNTPEIIDGSISDSTRLNSETLSTDTLNMSPSKETNLYETSEKRGTLSKAQEAAGSSRFDSDSINNVVLNTCSPIRWFKTTHRNDDSIKNSENNTYHNQENVVIKQEIMNEQEEGISKGCQIEQMNCTFTDINEYNGNASIKQEIIDDQVERISKDCQIDQALSRSSILDSKVLNYEISNKSFSIGQFESSQKNSEITENCSLLDEREIKRENRDIETCINEKVLLQNQVFIKNEVHEDVEIEREVGNNVKVVQEVENIEEETNDSLIGIGKKKRLGEDLFIRPRMIRCSLCDVYLETSLQDHITQRHQMGIFFECPYCDSSPKFTKDSHKTALFMHRKEFDLYCEFCGEKFRSSMDLHAHINGRHRDRVSSICSICGFEGYSYWCLTEHIIARHNGRTLVHNCQHCEFATMNTSLLQLHVDAKHTVNTIQVVHAPKQQPTVPQKKRREYTFKKLTRKCPLCGYTTKSGRGLQNHMKSEHAEWK